MTCRKEDENRVRHTETLLGTCCLVSKEGPYFLGVVAHCRIADWFREEGAQHFVPGVVGAQILGRNP